MTIVQQMFLLVIKIIKPTASGSTYSAKPGRFNAKCFLKNSSIWPLSIPSKLELQARATLAIPKVRKLLFQI